MTAASAALRLADGKRAWDQKVEGDDQSAGVALTIGCSSAPTATYLYSFDTRAAALAWRWKAGGDVIGVSGGTKGGAYYASLDNVFRVRQSQQRQPAVDQGNSDTAGAAAANIGWRRQDCYGNCSAHRASRRKSTRLMQRRHDGRYVHPPSDLRVGRWSNPVLKPYRVAIVVITRDGRAVGLSRRR